MTLPFRSGEPLTAAAPSRLFADWLEGASGLDRASNELRLVGPARSTSAPWFRDGGPASWRGTMLAELPDDASRDRFREDAAALAAGVARVVVTGQQPGVAGGPLLTVYKIATAIVLANRETDAGRTTIPVFWLGDDDDDVREASEPLLWDPTTGAIEESAWRAQAAAGAVPRRRLSRFVVPEGHESLVAWLERFTEPRDGFALRGTWHEAVARGRSWSEFIRRSLLRIFAGTGLMIVSGDDNDLHAAAAPFYRSLLERRDELGEAVRDRGRELRAAGWHAQIADRATRRPLFRIEGERRVAWDAGTGDVPPAELRPGVMLRSPVQDWLLAPAAVVVGPGELAYLRQLDALYERLGLRRCALIPRLSAWLLPVGFDPERLRELERDRPVAGETGPDWLETWLTATTEDLANLLAARLGLTDDRARDLAAARTRRWRKGLRSLVAGESRRRAEARRWSGPAWILPEGVRQERRLSWLGAFARWGTDLRNTLLAAAAAHLEAGATGHWRQLEITVPGLGTGPSSNGDAT